jgi:hypothetical protein
MFIRPFILFIIFILVGELFVRFDEKYKLLESSQIVKMSTDLTVTTEFVLLKNNAINLSGNNIRVLVLGDSFIHGGGIEFKDNFSQKLKLLLQINNHHFDNIYVLDLSKGAANNYDNNQIYFQFVNKFKPDIVILGYSYGATRGDLYKLTSKIDLDSFSTINFTLNRKKSLSQKIYFVLYNSRVLHLVLFNFHNYLKSYGLIIPNSEFDLNLNDYILNSNEWKRSKFLLSQINSDVLNKNIKLIVLKFPEMNLIEYPKLFKVPDHVIQSFYDNFPSINYINCVEYFKGKKSSDYILSKYDGHPNEKAHQLIALNVFDLISSDSKFKFKK